MKYELHKARMEEQLPKIERLFDSCVTDPPYGFKFMGKKWDYDVPSVEQFKLIYDKLKPGGYMLAFGGSRTFHRMAVNIEDAGFEIRDTVMWLYGQGFPKSLNISKAIDNSKGLEREVIGEKDLWGHNAGSGAGSFSKNEFEGQVGIKRTEPITAPASDLAKEWDGWGTALKPAYEPIIVARKPLDGTVAQNIETHGTGGINIDGCRVPLDGDYKSKSNGRPSLTGLGDLYNPETANTQDTEGRFPANIMHDGSDDVVSLFPEQKSGAMKKAYEYTNTGTSLGNPSGQTKQIHEANHGSASRFFYCAKTSRKDRNEGLNDFPDVRGGMISNTSGQHLTRREENYNPEPVKNNHPTVKPTELMQWCVRLVNKPGAWCLDAFCGSGSTGKACAYEGVNFVGIDQDDVSIAKGRIEFAIKDAGLNVPKDKPQPQIEIFQ